MCLALLMEKKISLNAYINSICLSLGGRKGIRSMLKFVMENHFTENTRKENQISVLDLSPCIGSNAHLALTLSN